jgi:hypothetical protein
MNFSSFGVDINKYYKTPLFDKLSDKSELTKVVNIGLKTNHNSRKVNGMVLTATIQIVLKFSTKFGFQLENTPDGKLGKSKAGGRLSQHSSKTELGKSLFVELTPLKFRFICKKFDLFY